MRTLMLLGILHRKLLKVKPQMFAGYQVGDMTKIPWRVMGEMKKSKLRKVKASWECVSMDKIESRNPRFLVVLGALIIKVLYLRDYFRVPFQWFHVCTSINLYQHRRNPNGKQIFPDILWVPRTQPFELSCQQRQIRWWRLYTHHRNRRTNY